MSIMDNIYIDMWMIYVIWLIIYILYTYQLSIVDTVYCMDDAWMIWVRPFAEMQGIIRQGALPWGDGGL